MARKTNIVETTNESTVALRMANAFDRAKAHALEDVSKPMAESKVKQTVALSGVAAASITIWELLTA